MDFLPSFELAGSPTRSSMRCENEEPAIGLSPWLFRHAAGQIRDEGLVRTRPHMLRSLNPNGEKDVLGLRIEMRSSGCCSRAAHVGDRDRP